LYEKFFVRLELQFDHTKTLSSEGNLWLHIFLLRTPSDGTITEINILYCKEGRKWRKSSNKRNYLTKSKLEELAEDINHESRMIVSLISKI